MAVGAKNADWAREEHILALALYFLRRKKLPGKTSKEVAELSQLLMKMGKQLKHSMGPKYRNANGVAMKLQNFKRCDPAYTGLGKKGLAHGNSQEMAIWREFSDDLDLLRSTAVAIREKFDRS